MTRKKTTKKKSSPRKSGNERRKVERRKSPRRFSKTPPTSQRRAKKGRRLSVRRSGVRRTSDTYIGKLEEFKGLGKKQEVLPPLEEEVITEGLENVSDDEPTAIGSEPDPTDPAPESENN